MIVKNRGVSAFTSHQEDTLNLLEQGETLFSKYESEGLMGGIFGSVGSVLVNENIRDYRGIFIGFFIIATVVIFIK